MKSRKIDFEEIKAKIVMNGQNATAMKVLKNIKWMTSQQIFYRFLHHRLH